MTAKPRLATLTLLSTLAGCAAFGGSSRTAPTPTTAAPAVTNGAGTDEIRALVTEAVTPQLCPRLLGSFIGLPGEGTARGPAAGTLATVGRWWVRSCTAQVHGDRLELSLGGMGWTWVDREASGFRIRQYLLFEAEAALGADVTVGYDRAQRVASLWMTPAQGVEARITPRGVVSPAPTGFFSRVLGGVAGIAGQSISERASAQAGELGSAQLRERLGLGFTMTLSLASRQVDFMVGALQRGETPERPYPASPSGPWVLNQRVQVWPGGLDVAGPVELVANGRMGLDLSLEEGDGAVVRAVCADALGRYFDARFRDPSATPEAPAGTVIAELGPGAAERHVALPASIPGSVNDHGCQALLTVAVRPGSTLPARLRYRVAPEPAEGASTASAEHRPSRVRIQLVGATLRAQNAAGHDWDVVGGEADPTVLTASVPLGREVDRSPVIADRNGPQWNRWLPGVFEVARELPLRFTVFDDDATDRELVGSADLEPAALPSRAGEVSLPLRTTGAVPVAMGTLRLRVEPVP